MAMRRLQATTSHLGAIATAAAADWIATGAGCRIVIGCNQFGTRLADVPAALALMAELGLDELDTARGYGGGQSEATLGPALAALPAKNSKVPFVATKAGPPLGYEETTSKLDASLAALGISCVDLWYLHSPDPEASLTETLQAVGDAHKAGKFKEWGLSNFSPWQVVQIAAYCREHSIVPPTVFQGSYHVLQRHQTEHELLPALRAHGIRFMAYSPLAGGLLTGKHSFEDAPREGRYEGGAQSRWGARWWKRELFDAIEALQAECGKYGVSMAAAAIRWAVFHSALSREYGDAVILGASSVDQLTSNAECAAAGPLPQVLVDFMDELHELTGVRGAVPAIGSTFMPLSV
jgi:aflatoxin B1 aldehyde reductase